MRSKKLFVGALKKGNHGGVFNKAVFVRGLINAALLWGIQFLRENQ